MMNFCKNDEFAPNPYGAHHPTQNTRFLNAYPAADRKPIEFDRFTIRSHTPSW